MRNYCQQRCAKFGSAASRTEKEISVCAIMVLKSDYLSSIPLVFRYFLKCTNVFSSLGMLPIEWDDKLNCLREIRNRKKQYILVYRAAQFLSTYFILEWIVNFEKPVMHHTAKFIMYFYWFIPSASINSKRRRIAAFMNQLLLFYQSK